MEEPAESLRSDQVELRRWRMSDLDALERAIRESLDHLVPWMPWAADHSRERTADFLARSLEEWESGQAFGYAITSDGAVIGGCGLMRRIGEGGLEIGYWLHARRTGRGLVTMAVAALAGQGFALPGIDRLEIHHDAANPASGAVALRLGFTEIERVPEPEGPSAPGEVGIEVVWRMTADQWRANAGAAAASGSTGGTSGR
jgi:RimJ/RimL family protein N-acetyltransferase